MTATVEATVIITMTPETRTGRRATGDEARFAYATAKAAGMGYPTRWELFAFSKSAMTALMRVGLRDTVTISGGLAVRVDDGAAIVAVNIETVALRLPGFPRPKAPKPARCGKGTPLATIDGVAEANARFAERNRGGLSV
jgi:hypothetical protein